MNKKPIGSRQAAKMARGKLGEKSFVGRMGKTFIVGQIGSRELWGFRGLLIAGRGKSWESALRDAGVIISDAPYFPPSK